MIAVHDMREPGAALETKAVRRGLWMRGRAGMRGLLAASLLAVCATGLGAPPPSRSACTTWTLMNPTGREYRDEVIRLKVDVPDDISANGYTVTEDGRAVAWQVEEIAGRNCIWVATDLGKGQTRIYRLERSGEMGERRSFGKRVKVTDEHGASGREWVLDNGLVAVRAPAEPVGLVGPLGAVRLPDGMWVGKSTWHTRRELKEFSSKLIGDGTVFTKVRLRYAFEGTGGLFDEEPSFYQADITLEPGKRHAVIEESYAMGRGDGWTFDCAAGWGARGAVVTPHFGGFGRPAMHDPAGEPYPWPPETLKVGQTRMGDTLLNLVPRWSQAYDDGWFFMATDAVNGVGAMVCRAGKWLWPYDGMIEIKVKESADYAGLRCPTWRGKRYWYLVAGPSDAWATDAERDEYAMRYAVEGLDKLHQEYILDWPGLPPPAGRELTPEEAAAWSSGAGRFSRRSKPFPGWGPGGANWGGGDDPIGLLTRVQSMFDPDTYGTHWLYFSPENPNFFSSWVNGMFGGIERLKTHPRFGAIRRLAEQKALEEVYFGVTLPGGAGQECFGYMSRGSWQHRMQVCRDRLGIDTSAWPWTRAAGSYILHTSHPMADGSRRSHPGGDTHPPGPDPLEAAREVGVSEDVTPFVSEELPGFGAVLRNRPGTPRETYFAFKSGPNRGHFHGDQLAFHYCANGRPLIVDHHCSYGPRAGQEHMHNRVAFHTDGMPWANMDGYERLIAFKTSDAADVAIGQVESERLREKTEFPPERWDWSLPQVPLAPNLTYRRTVVLLKGGEQDYVVIRDQSAGPELYASYCLHVYGETCERRDRLFDFDGVSVFVAHPTEFVASRHDWEHGNGGREATKGLRLTTRGTTSEFITVLLPKPLQHRTVTSVTLADALQWDARPKRAPSPVLRTGDLLVLLTWDGDRLMPTARLRAPAMHGAFGSDAEVTATVEGDQLRLTLKADVNARQLKARADLTVLLPRRRENATGTYEGTLVLNPGTKSPQSFPRSGDAMSEWQNDAVPPLDLFAPTALPRLSAIRGGVRIGNDEVMFGGSLDDRERVVYVTVERDGKEVLRVTSDDVDLNRSQGEIGIFIPDAGYPFGVLPDWLLRQRTRRPEWYEESWPPTAYGGE